MAYDVIIIGAGHNGLVAANYLAKAGKKVLVLERRNIPGGQLVSESLGDGFNNVDTLHASAQLRPDIVADLGLRIEAPRAGSAYTCLLDGGKRLTLDADPARASAAIREFSARDAERWPEFVTFMDRAAAFLDAAYRTPMPRLPHFALREGLPLAGLLWKLRRLGGRDMFRVVRAMSMSAEEFTGDWFESEALRAAVSALAIHGVTLGPMSAGTGYTLMHNWLNRGGLAHRPVAGGVGTITAALVEALIARGGEVRTSAEVRNVVVEHQRARGVCLASGEEITADCVISAADPRRTFLQLVGAAELPPEFVWQAQSIKLRGCVAKVHIATDGRHGLPDGTLAVAPSIRYLERAYDAAKYGEISAQPYLEVTMSGNIVSIHFQFAPYALRQADWEAARAVVAQRAIDTLDAQYPGFKASVQRTQVITARDLESNYGLSEGDLNHGQLILDQIFFMRPLPGWSKHATPIDGLYLCGSGVHGGGGISGASGRNAARSIVGDSR
ncbi:phytoene desaturase family protein [Rudaea cellulosilytica]|uniref:phytoene desaturase family protein n=1 Tax=Rudaea cellulosilytica TaxID=540746 RepID=UPI000363C3DF|nr:NAD(P)/FAD-dependent oxidoreductase [Rudaea cellulosilytica]